MFVVRALATPRLIPTPRRVEWPSVGVVVATRCRPHLLRRAVESVTRQDYPGPLRVVVVVCVGVLLMLVCIACPPGRVEGARLARSGCASRGG